jgi:thiosulfate/3-mercaptopyruvate sulfurtransferase
MRRLEIALALSLSLTLPAAAQEPQGAGTQEQERMHHNRHLLMSADSLAAQLASVVVIHVGRSDSAYRAGHVPGALFLPLAAVATTVEEVPNEFPAPADMARTFRELGVGDRTRIVIYGDDPGLFAARAWVALDLLGHGDQAALLDGGLLYWRAAQRPLDTRVEQPHARRFTMRWQAGRLVDASWVQAHLGDSGVVLLDARPADQYAGAAESPCPAGQPSCAQIPVGRRGHIPGARSFYWMNLFTSPGNPVVKSMHEIHEGMLVPLGTDRDEVKTLVTYCRTGMQASFAYFVARWINYPDVRLYDGSFIQWSAQPASLYPVETGATR